MTTHIEPTADVGANVRLGDGTSVWHYVQIREDAQLGRDCVVGRGVYIGPGVQVGDNVKIQNHALVYDPAEIGNGVFIGPAVILTNDAYPRAVEPDGTIKRSDGWEAAGVVVGDGASLGARSVVLAGVHVGAWALVGAGSVVVRDVPAHALVAGNPARQIGWVGYSGHRLQQTGETSYCCPTLGTSFELSGSDLRVAHEDIPATVICHAHEGVRGA